MKWLPGRFPDGAINPWYQGTSDLMYSVSKARMNRSGEPDRFRYAAHRIGEQKELGFFDAGDEAKAACEKDAKRRAAK